MACKCKKSKQMSIICSECIQKKLFKPNTIKTKKQIPQKFQIGQNQQDMLIYEISILRKQIIKCFYKKDVKKSHKLSLQLQKKRKRLVKIFKQNTLYY